jgi:hypothetical protein
VQIVLVILDTNRVVQRLFEWKGRVVHLVHACTSKAMLTSATEGAASSSSTIQPGYDDRLASFVRAFRKCSENNPVRTSLPTKMLKLV